MASGGRVAGPGMRWPRSVVTVGAFDGVHLGHQALVREVRRRADALDAAAVVVSFEPHPGEVLGHPVARLTTREERGEALAQLEADRLHLLRFDARLAGLSAEEFVRDVLVRRCGMTELVIGTDGGFGKDRAANRRTLPGMGHQFGFAVHLVEPIADREGKAISSSGIRRALQEGDLKRAGEWLGRPYRMIGRVVPGAGRGQTIGFRTINLDGPPPEKALPPDGVYAARVEWGGGTAGAMLNQGTRPTVGDGRRSVEAHLFDFDGDLYGRTVRIEWVERIRDIRRFESLDALRHQLELDRERASAITARPPETSTARPVGAR
jgi:riboflavin kinase/FMN adenylyltransferase